MRVLFVSNLYPPNAVGGYERLCFDVASAFAARGHTVSVLTGAYGGRAQDYPGQAVDRSLRLLADERDIYRPFCAGDGERQAINKANVAALQRAVARERPDVIFAWNLMFLDRSLLEALERSGVRVVAMLTDNWLLAQLDGGFMSRFFARHVFGSQPFEPGRRRSLLHRLRRLRQPSGARLPLAVDAVFGSAFIRDLHAEAGIGFRSNVVIHNGVRIQRRPEEAFRDRSRPVAPGELRLLFAGRIVDLKGVHTVIEALPLLRQAMGTGGPSIRLTLVGDARDQAYGARIQALIDSTGTADLIRFAQPVAESRLFDLFQDHDLYLFPSLYEPFSLTLILALAAGIPTIASRAGGNREIVADGRTGLLFDAGDAHGLARSILTLANDPALRHKIALGGRDAAQGFTFERMVTGMEGYLFP